MPRSRLLEALEQELPGASLQEAEGRCALLPRSGREVARALSLAASAGVKIVGPGADGDADGHAAVCMDLRRMADVLSIDDTSHIVHAEAGIDLAHLEEELGRRGLTLGIEGPVPEIPLGTWLARGAPGARDRADDPVDSLVAGVEMILPDGRELELRPAPRRAVGPDLIGTVVGARGCLGVVIGAHVVARRRMPPERLAFRFGERRPAEATLAWIRGRGVRPAAAHLLEHGGSTFLCITLRMAPERARIAATVARAEAGERGGEEVDPADAPEASPPTARVPAEIVLELAERLDPAGVLRP